MTTIEPGCTVSRTVGSSTELVTIDRACEWGGWYGTNEDGKSVRVTEKSLVNATQYNHNVQEDTNMASKPASKVTAADRRARRNGNGNTATVELTASEKLDMALSNVKPKPSATPRNANGTIKAKPKAAPVAKQAPAPSISVPVKDDDDIAPYGFKADGTPRKRPVPTWLNGDNTAATESPVKSTPQSTVNTIKESNTMPVKSARKSAAAKPVATEVNVEALAAELAAKLVADMIASGELTTTVEPVAQRSLKPVAAKATAKATAKPVAKTVKVTLKAKTEKRHSWHFSFMGKVANPVVTGCYITKDAIAQFEAGEKSITVEFDRAEGKKHSILFREAGDSTVFNGSIYLMRNALNGSGITEDTPITVVATVKSENEITLTIQAA